MTKEDFRKLCLPLIMDSVDACGAVIEQETNKRGDVLDVLREISLSLSKAASLISSINKAHRWFVSQISAGERTDIIEKLTKHVRAR